MVGSQETKRGFSSEMTALIKTDFADHIRQKKRPSLEECRIFLRLRAGSCGKTAKQVRINVHLHTLSVTVPILFQIQDKVHNLYKH